VFRSRSQFGHPNPGSKHGHTLSAPVVFLMREWWPVNRCHLKSSLFNLALAWPQDEIYVFFLGLGYAGCFASYCLASSSKNNYWIEGIKTCFCWRSCLWRQGFLLLHRQAKSALLRLSPTGYPLGYPNPKWVFNRIPIASNRVPIWKTHFGCQEIHNPNMGILSPEDSFAERIVFWVLLLEKTKNKYWTLWL
jgi:hypothetical protein